MWTTIGARLRSPCDADNASDATGDGRVSQGGRWVAGVLERNGREGQENTVSRRRRQGVCDMICWLSWRSGVRERAPHRSRGPASTPLEVLETREHVRSTIFPCDHMPFLNRDNSTHRSRMKRTAWITSTVVSILHFYADTHESTISIQHRRESSPERTVLHALPHAS